MSEEKLNRGENTPEQEENLNDVLKVRRQKLDELRAAGKDPFRITKYNVTHHSADISADYDAGKGAFKTCGVKSKFRRKFETFNNVLR